MASAVNFTYSTPTGDGNAVELGRRTWAGIKPLSRIGRWVDGWFGATGQYLAGVPPSFLGANLN